jgi:secretion/DNA translocation related TadE-like protein
MKRPERARKNPSSRQHRERGSGTVLALGLGLVVIMATVMVVLLAQAAVMASRAAAAADLAALAAADAARGIAAGEPCAVAREVAKRNDARVLSCAEGAGETVQVRTELSAATSLGPATGLARAGPPPGPAYDPSAEASGPRPRTDPPRATARHTPSLADEGSYSAVKGGGGLLWAAVESVGRGTGTWRPGGHPFRGVLQQHVDQRDGGVLVQGVVLVAALG